MSTATDIEVLCPKCAQSLLVDASMAGEPVECPQCRGRFIVGNSSKARPVPPKSITVTTTASFDGYRITDYLGVISTQTIAGVNLIDDLMGSVTDIIGGRSETLERALNDARGSALRELKKKAESSGADAIVGLQLDVETLGSSNGMLMVVATGTAVRIERIVESADAGS